MKRDVKPGFQKPTIRALKPAADGWSTAVALVERWLARKDRVDTMLEGLTPGLPARERARAQQLFYGVVRWASRLESALAGLMSHAPRTKVRAILLVAGFELLEGGPDAVAKVVHHAVEKAKTIASAKEAGLINAVARKLAGRLAEPPRTLADEFAHPDWLVARWTQQFGADATRQLLAWNQQPAPVYARWRKTDAPVPVFLAPTQWAGFYEVKAVHWDEVRQLAGDGALYLQDPSTRLCLELLAPRPGETILDACAAPGGKSLFIADLMQSGRVIALDEEGPRLERLRENLARAPRTVEVALMPADLEKVGTPFFRDFSLPETYDAVLLDAPCSNTGVMRHRVDVKWRLQEGDFAKHAVQQLALLHAAARLVRPGGRLVYSTCSIDTAENEAVIKTFFDSRAGGPFKLEKSVQAFPWTAGHDGAGAFLLRKNG
ncbi:MAG: RNA methyltransferase [Opitutae bacterium]|nr:RNA methyltransferase [Opitutae bacterium]